MRKLALISALALLFSACAHQQRIDHHAAHPQNYEISQMLGKMLIMNGYPVTAVKYCIWDKPDVVNAFMTKENLMIFTTGLLDKIPRNSDTLRCIMAHELAHYKLGHCQTKELVNVGTETGVNIALIVLETLTGVPGLRLAGLLITPTITSAYSRSQELDADREVVLILANTGVIGAIGEYTEALRWLKHVSSDRGFALWATHPSFEDRINALTEEKGSIVAAEQRPLDEKSAGIETASKVSIPQQLSPPSYGNEVGRVLFDSFCLGVGGEVFTGFSDR